jgi:hypothetical protein
VTIDEAREQVNTRIAQIERKNPAGELRPWDGNACPDALEHWGLTQQRIALNGSNPRSAACCGSLDLDAPERSDAQKAALTAARAVRKAA